MHFHLSLSLVLTRDVHAFICALVYPSHSFYLCTHCALCFYLDDIKSAIVPGPCWVLHCSVFSAQTSGLSQSQDKITKVCLTAHGWDAEPVQAGCTQSPPSPQARRAQMPIRTTRGSKGSGANTADNSRHTALRNMRPRSRQVRCKRDTPLPCVSDWLGSGLQKPEEIFLM